MNTVKDSSVDASFVQQSQCAEWPHTHSLLALPATLCVKKPRSDLAMAMQFEWEVRIRA